MSVLDRARETPLPRFTVARPPRILGDIGLHLLMIVVMIVVMLPGASAISRLGGAAVLVVAAVGLAVPSRRRPHLRLMLIDLWAMILLIVLHPLPGAPVEHTHGMSVPSVALAILVVVGWIVARAIATRDRYGAVTAALTGIQLAVMLLPALTASP